MLKMFSISIEKFTVLVLSFKRVDSNKSDCLKFSWYSGTSILRYGKGTAKSYR